MKCVLSTAYLPPVEYFVAIANCGGANVEGHEMYQKQSWRNRCNIFTTNGPMYLNIPVRRSGVEHSHKIPIADVLIDYSDNWVRLHKRAIDSAYMNSPFFEYYRDDIFSLMECGEESLLRFNTRLTEKLLELCGVRAEISFTDKYERYPDLLQIMQNDEKPTNGNLFSQDGILDLRSAIHPKHKGPDLLRLFDMEKPYWQVFSAKQGFIPNLSIIDLLFNEGPNSISYLTISRR